MRLVVEQVEQQRQLAFVLLNRQTVADAVGPSRRTIIQRVRDVHSSSSTAGRTAGSSGIASAPKFIFILSYLIYLSLLGSL